MTCLALVPGVALAAGLSSQGGFDAPSPLQGSLVVAGMLTESEQLKDAEQARRSAPAAVAARLASRTRFERLDLKQAAALASEAFPVLVRHLAGGPPRLPAGQRIVGFSSANSAEVDLGGRKRGVIESVEPIARETSPGRLAPVDLSLRDVGGAFETAAPLVRVRIPARLRDGIELPAAGVSVTPVDGSGAPLGGSAGVIDGATALYANTQTDMDSLVKPVPAGFETDTVLRSVQSPQQLFFRVGVPRGAKIVQARGGAGRVQVLDGGVAIASILPAVAEDAAGTTVPVAMRLSGDILTLTVDHRAGQYRYPIVVDPTVQDVTLHINPGNWAFNTNYPAGIRLAQSGGSLGIEGFQESIPITAAGILQYPTQGESRVYAAEITTFLNGYTGVRNSLDIENPSKRVESNGGSLINIPRGYEAKTLACVESACTVPAVTSESKANVVNMEAMVTEPTVTDYFESWLMRAAVDIVQEAPPRAITDTAREYVNGKLNGFYLDATHRWINGNSTTAVAAVGAIDPGIGISEVAFKSPSASGWGRSFWPVAGCQGDQCDECWFAVSECSGKSSSNEELTYPLVGLPEGVDTVEATVENSTGATGSQGDAVMVDDAPPHSITMSGLPAGNEIEEKPYVVKASARDNASGVQSIALAVDGQQVGKPLGSCATEDCLAAGEWAINGANYSVGEHRLTVTATDNVGNVAKEEYVLKVRAAAPVAVGPGLVDSQSGELSLAATDVSASAPGGGLTVGRSYRSRHLTAGSEGPLGPQWSLDVNSEESITKLASGDAMLTTANGRQSTFFSSGSESFTSPTGDANLKLRQVKGSKGEVLEYVLRDEADGASTNFTSTTGPTATLWTPGKREGPLSSQKTRYIFRTVEGVTEPVGELAPEPTGISTCYSKLEKHEELPKGCRALEFVYATATNAKIGENESEWSEYKGRLKEVLLVAYNPASPSKATVATPVAQYAYDKLGRLRAVWNPQISPALKTIYGYDAEGHVTAVSSPGQQPWLLHYGGISSDATAGRLLSAVRGGVASALWNGEALAYTAVPTLSSTSPVVGTTLSVASNGTWSNGPLAYTYQWEDCTGALCTAIAGATNQSYTPRASDAGYTLVAAVTALNAGGTAVASSAATSVVPLSAPKWSLAFGVNGSNAGQLKEPDRAAIDASGDVWVTDDANNRIDKFTSAGTFVATYGFGVNNGEAKLETCTASCLTGIAGSGNGQLNDPVGVAINQAAGDVYVTDEGNSRVEEYTTAGAFVRTIGSLGMGLGQFYRPEGIGVDPNGDVWVGDDGDHRIEEFTAAGVFMQAVGTSGSGPGQFAAPGGIAFLGETMYVADFSNKRVEEFALSGAYLAQFASVGEPSEIGTNAAAGEIYETDLAGKVDEFNQAGTLVGSFGAKGTGTGDFLSPEGVVVSASGNVYVVDSGNSRVQEWTPTYSTNNPVPAAPNPGTTSVSTVEYGVPLSGTGLQNLTSGEVAQWGQKDDPVEAVAVLPPSAPEGWPAASYKGATVYYQDAVGRTVNVATPSGGVSTREFNTYNDVVRTLTPDNRTAALAETGKTVEASKLLDSESTYNTTGEPGTQLLEALGPQHTVKLAQGKEKAGEEVLARNREQFFYDEGAPAEGGPYDLVTKSITGAQTASKEEFDKRETMTSYSGQENLGWKLRKPTSVTIDPNGLKLTHTTLYEPTTGNLLETRSPKGSGSGSPAAPAYAWQLAPEGTGEGQVRKPMSEAFDSSGNLWVVDNGNDRIQVFSATGTLLKKFGSEGTAGGQFLSPWGIAINASTGNVYVSDTTNDRIEEFSSAGTFMRTFGFGVSTGEEKFQICTTACVAGKVGSGSGQFHSPQGVAVDSAGNVWVVDEGNSRIEEFNEKGEYLSAFGTHGGENGQFHEPAGIAISGGNLYVAEYSNSRVQEFSTKGVYITQFGAKGTGSGQFEGAEGIAADPVTGDLYVTDFGNGRVEEFTTGGVFVTAFGAKGSGAEQLQGPEGIAVSRAGALYVSDTDNSRIEVWQSVPSAPVFASTIGSYGSESGQLSFPTDAAVDVGGNLWTVDSGNNRVEEFSPAGAFVAAYGTKGTGASQFSNPGGIAVNQTTGNVYVADSSNNRIEELSSAGKFVAVFGFGVSNGKAEFQTCTTTCQAGIAGAGNGQFSTPTGVAIGAAGGIWVVDHGNNRVEQFSSGNSFTAAYGTKGAGNLQFSEPRYVALWGGNVYVTDPGNERVEELSTAGAYVGEFGSYGTGNGQFAYPYGIAADPNSGNLYVGDPANGRVEEFTPAGKYLSQMGDKGSGNGQLKEAEGITVNAAGAIDVVDTGNSRIEQWAPAPRPGNEGAHDTRTVYYSTGEEASVAACRKHPEWAGLTCQTGPAAQPGVSGLAELPVTTTTYNMWDQAETTTQTVGSTTRTTSATYDAAGRLKTNGISSTVGTVLPTVTDEYNATTGALEKQCANGGKPCTEGKPKTLTSVYNSLGALTSYTDSDENATTYEYEGEGSYKGASELDGRVRHVNDQKGTETFTYNGTTGLLTELLNEYGTAKLLFTATYDVEGNLLTEGYPNGMNATYTYNPAGTATKLEYVKTTHCTEKCTWFSDAVVPSIHDQVLEQTSTLSRDAYSYDAAGRLAQVQDTPAGKVCTTRVYAYDEDTNRTSLTTREPNSKGECATEGGLVEQHSYDSADRLIDTGATYSTFGNINALPAADAGGNELTSAYYVDSQLASQTQNGETIGYNLDPAGRTREIVSTGKTTQDVINHYAAGDGSPAWTTEPTSGVWTRDIQGIGGGLAAIQINGATPVLQLTNLHGDIVATAALSETETKLASEQDTTEYGVPTTTTPAKYSWLGAGELQTELPSGVVAMGARSYVPKLGRFLQADPIPGGSANAYGYVYGDPIDESDPSGEYSATFQEFALESSEQRGEELLAAIRAAEEAAARAAEEAAARAAAANAASSHGSEAEIRALMKQAEATWCGEGYAACPEESGGGFGGASVNLHTIIAASAASVRKPGCYTNGRNSNGSWEWTPEIPVEDQTPHIKFRSKREMLEIGKEIVGGLKCTYEVATKDAPNCGSA
ncbi:MAG TPA: RHS repeat-associated core domain-containing protein [Solirubrobacteraceae bacterium]|nr:RHS repeat-associated core domain-containing protein [Solirubrobacteraceae bacterium]